MSRILSTTQKKELFKAIPASVTIGETTITASKIWSNQILTTYPSITLNVSQDGLTDLTDIKAGPLYYRAMLTVHILAKTVQGIQGARLAETLANEVFEAIAAWTTPIEGDVRIFDSDTDIKSLQYLGQINGVFDYVFSAIIYHS